MNNDNIDFKNLWKQQIVSKPNLEEFMAQLIKFKKVGLRTYWITTAVLAVTTVVLVCIWVFYRPQFTSTKIGLVLTILAMVVYFVVYNRVLNPSHYVDVVQSNQNYVQNLIAIKKRQKFMQSTMLSVYFCLLTIGICLYIYEYTRWMSLDASITVYGLTIAWSALNWFYLRPNQMKKQQIIIDELIIKSEEISSDLIDNEIE
jgi:predicted membrane-bound mannosyltransferase